MCKVNMCYGNILDNTDWRCLNACCPSLYFATGGLCSKLIFDWCTPGQMIAQNYLLLALFHHTVKCNSNSIIVDKVERSHLLAYTFKIDALCSVYNISPNAKDIAKGSDTHETHFLWADTKWTVKR